MYIYIYMYRYIYIYIRICVCVCIYISCVRTDTETYLQDGTALFQASLVDDYIWTSVSDKCSGSINIIAHLDHISHFKTASCTNWQNRWTY